MWAFVRRFRRWILHRRRGRLVGRRLRDRIIILLGVRIPRTVIGDMRIIDQCDRTTT
jgi:hypothetical protein